MGDLVSEADGWLKDRGPYNSAATEEMFRELRNALSDLLAAAEPFVGLWEASNIPPVSVDRRMELIRLCLWSSEFHALAKAVEAVKGDGR